MLVKSDVTRTNCYCNLKVGKGSWEKNSVQSEEIERMSYWGEKKVGYFIDFSRYILLYHKT